MDDNHFIDFMRTAFDAKITKDSLVEMNPSFLTDIYFIIIADIGQRHLNQPDLQAFQGIDNIHCCYEFSLKQNLIKAMQIILDMREYKGAKFTIIDLIYPQKKRTMTILGHLVQVWMVFKAARERHEGLLREREPHFIRCEAERTKIESLRQKLENLSAEVAKLKTQHSSKLQQLAANTPKLNALKAQCEDLEATYSAEKQALLDSKADAAEKELVVKQLQEQLETSKRLVVPSPEEFKDAVTKKKAEIANFWASKRNLDSQITEQGVSVKIHQSISSQAKAIHETLIHPLASCKTEKLQETSDEMRAVNAVIAAGQVERDNHQRTLTAVQRNLELRQTELDRLKSSEEHDLASIKQLVADAEAEHSKNSDKMAKLELLCEEKIKQHDQKIDTIAKQRQEYDKRFNEIVKIRDAKQASTLAELNQ